jgi:ribonuclease HI
MKTNTPSLLVATDASVATSGRYDAGWAWIDQRGGYGAGTVPAASVLVAELHAVHQALLAGPQGRPLVVLTDSRPAVLQVQRVLATGVLPDRRGRADARQAAAALHAVVLLLRRTGAELRWVKGHSGHRLNDAADRLAVQTRRAGGPQPIEALLARIAREAVAA